MYLKEQKTVSNEHNEEAIMLQAEKDFANAYANLYIIAEQVVKRTPELQEFDLQQSAMCLTVQYLGKITTLATMQQIQDLKGSGMPDARVVVDNFTVGVSTAYGRILEQELN
jgi:hypothetical protein